MFINLFSVLFISKSTEFLIFNHCVLISTVRNILSRIFKSFDMNILVRHFVLGCTDTDKNFFLS